LSEKFYFHTFFQLCHHLHSPYFHPVRHESVIYLPKQPFRLKTSREHLPGHKRLELHSIKESIVRYVNPEMAILFGRYSRSIWVGDRYYNNGTLYEYKSDYDILVVNEHLKDMLTGLGKLFRQRIKQAEQLDWYRIAVPTVCWVSTSRSRTVIVQWARSFSPVISNGEDVVSG
jgi:hypothetical protein